MVLNGQVNIAVIFRAAIFRECIQFAGAQCLFTKSRSVSSELRKLFWPVNTNMKENFYGITCNLSKTANVITVIVTAT